MTCAESLEYVESLKERGSIPGLERIKELLRLLGDPHKKLKCIHITGTNGKGSVCAMLSNVLRFSGYNVGLYSSPYVNNINEMFRLNGKDVSDYELTELISQVRTACDAVGATQYEFFTAVAFFYYSKVNPDFVIVECCMGGLLDTTNVIDNPILSVITSVALDHTSFLGDTLEKIARHKAGIIKRNCPCVASVDNTSVKNVINDIASLIDAPVIYVADKPNNVQASLRGTSFEHPMYGKFSTSLIGTHQADNAMTVIACCSALSNAGFNITLSDIKCGLESTFLNARFEILDSNIPVIYDGGHNVHGVLALSDTLKQVFRNQKVIGIASVMKDKQYSRIAEIMAPYLDTVFTTAPEMNERALDPAIYSEVYRKLNVPAYPCMNIASALSMAMKKASEGQPIVAFGSLYTYKQFVDELNKIY